MTSLLPLLLPHMRVLLLNTHTLTVYSLPHKRLKDSLKSDPSSAGYGGARLSPLFESWREEHPEFKGSVSFTLSLKTAQATRHLVQ